MTFATGDVYEGEFKEDNITERENSASLNGDTMKATFRRKEGYGTYM